MNINLIIMSILPIITFILGAFTYTLVMPPKIQIQEVEVQVPVVVTETVLEIKEIEIPVVTEKIVKINTTQILIDPANPVIKWVDPDNFMITYLYPPGYEGNTFPMYATVPPVWYDFLLGILLEMNDGRMPPASMTHIPPDWYDGIAPRSEYGNEAKENGVTDPLFPRQPNGFTTD